MIKRPLFLPLIFLLISYTPPVFALDIYSLVDTKCNAYSGLIVNVDDADIQLIDLSGKILRIQKTQLNAILVFNTLQSPIKTLHLTPEAQELLKDVYIKEDDRAVLRGWAVKFIEELVIFYDIHGKTHVLNLFDISRLRPVKHLEGREWENSSYKEVVLNLSGVPSLCPNIQSNGTAGVRPTQIITDKIRMSEFLSKFQKGFARLASFQERTYLYAKPYLFEKRSKLGIVIYKRFEENSRPVMPMYYQWSSGQPYRFQSFTVLGSSHIEWVPNLEPVFAVRSDLKSHIFNASFAGNIIALPAGESYFFAAESFTIPDSDISLNTHFNYLALMGGDWGPYSFSFGSFYPVYLVKVNDEIREVLASTVSPTLRFLYTKDKLRFRIVYSRTRKTLDSGEQDRQIRVSSLMFSDLDNFKFSNDFFRVGLDYDFTDKIKIGLDEVILKGKYSETASGIDNSFDFTHLNTSLSIKYQFGHFVSLKVHFNYYLRHYDYEFFGVAREKDDNSPTYGGVFEFVF